MKLLPWFHQRNTQKPASFSLVDIGRDTVKAVVILKIPDTPEPQVVGYGLAQTGGHDISGGRLEAAAVTNPVNTALTRAEDSTEAVIGQKIVPDDVIFALAGRATVGELFTVRQTRPHPAEPISAKELSHLKTRAERLARQRLAQRPVESGYWQALAVTDAGIRLDDHLVLDGVGLTGQDLSFSIFGVAGQAGALRALELLANRLDLVMVDIVCAWQALAAAVPYAEAIVLDVGFSGTDVCLIRDNALVAAGWIPVGGELFSQALVQVLEIGFGQAKQLMHALSNENLRQAEAEEVELCLEQARQRWYEAVMGLLAELSVDKLLPWKIYLTGGGSLLPGLDKLLRTDPTPFSRAPEVVRLGQHLPRIVKDLTDGLDHDLFSLALSLTIGVPQ
jgi:cell division ATPase FtsA